jgi:hypothetical protein
MRKFEVTSVKFNEVRICICSNYVRKLVVKLHNYKFILPVGLTVQIKGAEGKKLP